jgi:hypothetical protein
MPLQPKVFVVTDVRLDARKNKAQWLVECEILQEYEDRIVEFLRSNTYVNQIRKGSNSNTFYLRLALVWAWPDDEESAKEVVTRLFQEISALLQRDEAEQNSPWSSFVNETLFDDDSLDDDDNVVTDDDDNGKQPEGM